MNLFTFISLTATLACLCLGLLVLYLNRKPGLNKLFFFVILTGFIYSFTTVMMWNSANSQEALIWHKAGTMWPLFVASVLNFALVYTDNGWIKNKIHYLVLYLPAVTLWMVDLTTEYINTAPVLEYWGYNDQAASTWIYGVSTVWSALLPLLAFGVCFAYYRKTSNSSQKKTAKNVTVGFAIPIVVFIITNMLIRTLNLGVPNLGPISSIFFVIFVGNAVVKYDLFTINDALAAENIIAAIPDAIILTDNHGGILRVNERLVDFCGYSKDELIGQHITKLCGEKECLDILEELLEQRSIRNRELALRTKTGEVRYALFSGSAIQTKTGRQVGLTCILHDITERKQVEEDLANTNYYLDTLLNSMLSGIIVIDARDHKIVDANTTAIKMIGTSKEKIVGSICHSFICPAEKGKCPITDLDSEVENQEKELITAQGERKQILKNIVKLYLRDRLLLIENFVDVSQRKRMEKELAKSQRMASIGELAGQLGHDLRNPLAGIKNGVYILRKKGNRITEEERGEILAVIEAAIDDSNRIISSLIDYSSEYRVEPQLGTPKSLVDRALTSIDIPKHVTVRNEVLDETELFLDTPRIEDVFRRILQNSIHAIEKTGEIQIQSKKDENTLSIIFSDTGVGITKETLPNLFSPLVTTKAKGMGMGLAICKRIVEAHGGKITVESRVGSGTKITVTLPLEKNQEFIVPAFTQQMPL